MIRFVLDPGSVIVPDVAARLPGRGMWLSARADVLETACSRGAFARAARGQVDVPPDLADRVRAGLARRMTEFVGLARRAGQAVAGFEKAREWVRTGRAALILQASDGSEEERRRFLSGAGEVPVFALLPALTLGAVFGRDHVVHVAVARGKLATSLATDGERLAGLAGRQAKQVERSGELRRWHAEGQ